MTQRTASEVILEMEKKLDVALNLLRTQDMSIKILSNKLNEMQSALDKQNADIPKMTVEAVDNTIKQVASPPPIAMEAAPKGFRRTSRPTSYAGDDARLPTPTVKKEPEAPKFPVQIPEGSTSKVIPNKPTIQAEVRMPAPTLEAKAAPPQVMMQNAIPIQQRVVDAGGKSVFLANVIIRNESLEEVTKTRTSANGKWNATLSVGKYKIIIEKMEKLTSEKKEIIQDIVVTGGESPYILPILIIK